MAIDMTTVKQIMHNNKEVAKIEDSLGNILWQKQSPGPSIIYPFMAMSNNTYLYNKAVNDEWTWTFGTPGPVSNPQGQNYWSDGTHLYYSYDSNQYEYTGSLDNYDSTKWVAKSWNITFRGNNIIKINNELYMLNGSINYKYDSNTGRWKSVTITGRSYSMTGDTLWTDGTDIYWNTSNSKIRILDQTNLAWGSEITINATNSNSYYYWTDGTDVYYSNGSTHKVWDKANKNWINKTWSGLTNFGGNEVFFYNNEVYVRQAAGLYAIYKLNKATSTWTQTYTNPMSSTNFRGARMWDLGGRSTANTLVWLTGLRRPNK